MADDETKDTKPARIKTLKAVHVFTVGNYGPKGDWNEQKVDAMNADYRVALEKAKVKIRHVDAQPQHGYWERVWRTGRKVFADIVGISQELSDGIVNGSYEDRSAEIFTQHSTTGRPYWKGLAFLGAESPQVKEMDPLQFTDGPDGLAYVSMSVDEVDMTDPKDKTKQDPPRDGGGTVTMSEAEVVEFRAMRQKMSDLERDNLRLQAQSRRTNIESRIAALKAKEGGPRVLPAFEERLTALCMSMSNDTAVNFTADDKSQQSVGQVDLLLGIFGDLPALVRMTGAPQVRPGVPGDGAVTDQQIADVAFSEARAAVPEPGDAQTAKYNEIFEAKLLEAKASGKLISKRSSN